MERGVLPANFYAGGADCSGVPQFRVHAYNPDFFILRQAACTNYEKPVLYLLFGSERALLLDTGAGKVDVAGVVDTLVRGHIHEMHFPGVRDRGGQPLLHDVAYYTLNEIPKP